MFVISKDRTYSLSFKPQIRIKEKKNGSPMYGSRVLSLFKYLQSKSKILRDAEKKRSISKWPYVLC